MSISNAYVGFVIIILTLVIMILTLVITGLSGLIISLFVNDEDCIAIAAWFISDIGLAICLTYILVMKGFI